MHLDRLDIARLRCVTDASVLLQPGINLIVGDNGAGKTSVIEALYVLSHGRSFRGRVRDGLIQHGESALLLLAHWRDGHGAGHRVGLEHDGRQWHGRVDGEAVKTLAELASQVAIICFEPGSHALLSGAAENRRRFVDWGLFHVEPEFLDCWRRYARALRQRNALLKTATDANTFAAWEHELQLFGNQITAMRQAYLAKWEHALLDAAQQFLPELPDPKVSFARGWRQEDSLVAALHLSRERDQALGFTSVGPHRADWRLSFGRLGAKDGLSRGQTKLAALACVLAQAQQFAATHGDWPVVCLDDLASELDRPHQQRVIELVVASKAQVIITATEPIPALAALNVTKFHVELGKFTALL